MMLQAGDAPLVELRNVTVVFGDLTVVRDLSLSLAPGNVTALMGPNGVGKTTVARVVMGLVTPRSGIVTAPNNATYAAVFQDNRLCAHLSGHDNVSLVMRRRDRHGALEILEHAGIDTATARVPVHQLSGGQQRRVAIARAIAADGSIVVLDEPFTGIDTETKPVLLAAVAEHVRDRTCLIITHDTTEAARFNARIVRIPSKAATD